MNMTITKTEMQVRKEKVRTDEYKERQTIKKKLKSCRLCVFLYFFYFNAFSLTSMQFEKKIVNP